MVARDSILWSTLVALLACTLAAAGTSGSALRRHVEYLADDKREGRLTGTKGERVAADYIARELKALGARPLPGLDGFRLPFEFTAGTRDGGSSISLTAAEGGTRKWRGVADVRGLSFSDDATVSGEVVFAGYGLTVPETQDLSYDSYVGLDVTDKIVLVLRYSPEDVEDEMRVGLVRYSGLRYKAQQARDRGARAMIVVTGPRSPKAGETIRMGFDAAIAGSGIAAASVSGRVANALFAAADKSLEEVQRELDTGNPHVAGFAIPGVTLTLDVKVLRERKTGYNVVGLLPATGGDGGESTSYTVLGAHYDHLGRGRHGNSLARKEEAGQVHNGADDNASGVAAVLAAGARLASRERRHPILLAFWSGEELGLLGSSDFIATAPVPIDAIRAYLNFDMVGRMSQNRLNLQAVGSSTAWPALIEGANAGLDLDLHLQEDPYLPTDAAAFYRAGTPTVNFFTGSHEDYHRPSDDAASLDYEGVARAGQLGAALALELDRRSQSLDYVKVEPKTRGGGDRDTLRAYTGTIPDYATEVEGLRLSGVVGGGPADKAGLREGDVIVEFAGRRIANIYDYTYALDAVKIDVEVKVVFVRDGERRNVVILPTARP